MDSPTRISNASARILSPDKSVHAFITSISENREAFELFRTQAQKLGYLGQPKPLIHEHRDYYNAYIKKNNRSLEMQSLDLSVDSKMNKSVGLKNKFIPLKDLL